MGNSVAASCARSRILLAQILEMERWSIVSQQLLGSVGGPVVDHDHFKIFGGERLSLQCTQTLFENWKAVVSRDNHRENRRARPFASLRQSWHTHGDATPRFRSAALRHLQIAQFAVATLQNHKHLRRKVACAH